MVDDRFTWRQCGRSYLWRIIDMLQMKHVDEVFFGKEVVTGVPAIAREWVQIARKRRKAAKAPPIP